MFLYSSLQWVLFFAIYCFLGWCFESSYVSIKNKKITNRGFLYGPALPIYGFGAIVLLFATIPVRKNLFLTFVFGLFAATLLEYVTGVCMEAIFKVRYWDYSGKRFQYKGHICLSSSLAWGVMAVLLVNLLHKPVEIFVLALPPIVLEISSITFLLIFGFDFSQSLTKAMDIRAAITKLIKEHEELAKLQKHLDSVLQFAAESKKELHEDIEELKSNYNLKKQIVADRLESVTDELKKLKKRFPSVKSTRFNHIFK